MTVGEAADLLGFSPSTIQKLSDDGSLHTLRTPGGHRRIERGSLERYRTSQAGDLPAAAPRRPSGPSVLLVADDELSLAQLQHLVGVQFPLLTVATARDGMEGILQLVQAPPALVVVDLALPRDALRLAHLLRDRPAYRGIRVVVLSDLTVEQLAGHGGLPADVALFAKPLAAQRFLGYLDATAQQWLARPG